MNKFLVFLIIIIIAVSCKNKNKQNEIKTEYQKIVHKEFELAKPIEKTKAVIVLFGGYPEQAGDIEREFQILETAKKYNVAVLLMNYNQKLWLELTEKEYLAEQLQRIFSENKLPTDNIYLGGFSSGGNVALLISNYIEESGDNDVNPKGIFIVDSPIDLAELYQNAEKNVKRNFSEPSVQESTWLLETLGKQFGNPNDSLENYQQYSVYTLKTKNIDNLRKLKDKKIRFYTEPDTTWWKENRMADYEQINAYHIKSLSKTLKESNFKNVEYIPTQNRGYRANGDRHPHSWSIVNKKDLMKWILAE